MSFNINAISYNDVMLTLNSNDTTLGDLKEIGKFDEMLNKFLDCNMSDIFAFRCKMLAMYKLGEMQGKRAERAKKRKASVPVRNKMLSVLDEISNMSAEAQEIVNLEIELDKKKERLKKIQLKVGAGNEQ